MNITKTVAVKLVVHTTTQELFDNAMRELNGTNAELIDNIAFSLVTGYENNIKQLFRQGLLYIVFGADFREQLTDVEILEIHVTNQREELIVIKHSDIKDILKPHA